LNTLCAIGYLLFATDQPLLAVMEITAAVVREKFGAFTIDRLELTDPRPDEALVRIVASGMCQTDLHGRDGYYNTPYPAVYGHEGAGVVQAVGNGVTKFAPGDHVVISFPWCGVCPNCRRNMQSHCEGVGSENARHARRRFDAHAQGRRPGLQRFFPAILVRDPRHRQRTLHGEGQEGRAARAVGAIRLQRRLARARCSIRCSPAGAIRSPYSVSGPSAYPV
jgi:hypothetical protein